MSPKPDHASAPPKPAVVKQTLDEMVAKRTAQKLPAPPVFRRELVEVAPGGARGRKAATELEAAARANAEAAEEARRVALAQRAALEQVAAGQADMEMQIADLRRQMLEERSENERMVAQARFRATQEERRRLGTPLPDQPDAATADGSGVVVLPPTTPYSPEMRTLQTEIAEREKLGEAHRQRLLEALRERDASRLELQRVTDARMHAERRLEKITEVLHRATSAGGPRPAGGDGVEDRYVSELRDELAIAIARAKSAETRTNELRDEIDAVRTQRSATHETLETTRSDLDATREELSALHARLLGLEAEQRTSEGGDIVAAAEAHAREIEREVVEVRQRALASEQRAAELTETLRNTTHQAAEHDSVVAALRLELAEARNAADGSGSRVAELEVRAERIEAELAAATEARDDVESRLRAAHGDLVNADGARVELDSSVDELRSTIARYEAKVADLEAKLADAEVQHERHSVDLQAGHTATAAELASASGRAEHLAGELAARDERLAQLEAALAATTAELGEALANADDLTAMLATRDARADALTAELSERAEQLDAVRAEVAAGAEELAQLDAARAQALAAEAAARDEVDALRAALDQQTTAVADLESAVSTARAERDVAVAKADSLALEVGQLHDVLASEAARTSDLETAVAQSELEHEQLRTRLQGLSGDAKEMAAARDAWTAREAELMARIELGDVEVAAAQARVDDLEAVRSDDRRATEVAVAGLREKAESAGANIVLLEEQIAIARGRHTAEIERLSAELDSARRRVDEMDYQVTDRRDQEQAVRNSLRMAEARVDELERLLRAASEPRQSSSTSRAPELEPTPEPVEASRPAPAPVGVSVGAPSRPDPSERPSDLRRAVFASLTELAGDK